MAATKHSDEHPPFYGKEVLRQREQRYITDLLQQFRDEPLGDELKKKVWQVLQIEKWKGNITIPFKMVVRRDSSGKFPEYLEIILDTKV